MAPPFSLHLLCVSVSPWLALFRFLNNNFFQIGQHLFDLGFADDVRRQEAQHGVVRAVHQEASLHHFRHHAFAVERQLGADHQSEPARLFDQSGLAALQSAQLLSEVIADLRHALQQILLFEHPHKFEAQPAGERAAAESRTVVSGLQPVDGFLGDEKGAERDAQPQRLSYAEHVRSDRSVFEGEDLARAPESALHFVEYQQRVYAIAGLAHGLQEVVADGMDARFTLNRFDDDGGGPLVDRLARFGEIVRAVVRIYEPDAGDQRLERLAVFLLFGDRERAHRPAMKRIDERDELGLAFAPTPALPRARELQGALVRLRSGITEEDARQPRSLRQAVGDPP